MGIDRFPVAHREPPPQDQPLPRKCSMQSCEQDATSNSDKCADCADFLTWYYSEQRSGERP